LKLRRVEDAIVPECAYSQCLRIVFEGVRRGFDSFVAYLQFPILFDEREIDEGADAMDTSRSNITGDPEMAHVGLVAHVLELTDRYVIALIVTCTGEGEVAYGGDDDECRNDNLDGILVPCIRHGLYFEVRVSKCGLKSTLTSSAMAPGLEFRFQEIDILPLSSFNAGANLRGRPAFFCLVIRVYRFAHTG